MWGKVKGYSWWPGFVNLLRIITISDIINIGKKSKSTLLSRFFS